MERYPIFPCGVDSFPQGNEPFLRGNESFRCRFEPATIRFNLSTTHFGASTIGLLTETYGLASRDFVIAPCWIYMSWRRTRFLCAGLFQSRSGFRRLPSESCIGPRLGSSTRSAAFNRPVNLDCRLVPEPHFRIRWRLDAAASEDVAIILWASRLFHWFRCDCY